MHNPTSDLCNSAIILPLKVKVKLCTENMKKATNNNQALVTPQGWDSYMHQMIYWTLS